MGGLQTFVGDPVGPLPRPIEAPRSAVCYVRNTSSPAGCCAQIAAIPGRLANKQNRLFSASNIGLVNGRELPESVLSLKRGGAKSRSSAPLVAEDALCNCPWSLCATTPIFAGASYNNGIAVDSMGIFCSDKSITALAKLGYNVVHHPSANFRPMLLIGKQDGELLQLGSLNQLITDPPGPLPTVTAGEEGTGISGESSSKLDLGIGANILGSLIGAMGGNLGINVTYTDARRVEFKYTDVTLDSVVPLDVGAYLLVV
jgi:hypothetical protein